MTVVFQIEHLQTLIKEERDIKKIIDKVTNLFEKTDKKECQDIPITILSFLISAEFELMCSTLENEETIQNTVIDRSREAFFSLNSCFLTR